MRGLSNNHTSNRSKSTCSFCRSPNHQVGKCPHVPIVWASLQQGIVPLEYMNKVPDNGAGTDYRSQSQYWRSPLSGYYTRGENWGDLFKQASRAYDKWEKAQARAKAKKKGKKRSATQTCGYCGEKGHTRRTCTHLSTLKADLVRANRNFRQWFYEEYVVQQRLSTGCIIEADIQISGGYNKPSSQQTIKTIVTEINWDTINLFSTFLKNQIDWRAYHNSPMRGKIGQDRLNNIISFVKSDILLKFPFTKAKFPSIDLGYYYKEGSTETALCLDVGKGEQPMMDFAKQGRLGYSTPIIKSVRIVSPAPQVLADDWVDGYSDEMSVILKKFSQEELDYVGITEHIKIWANKSE